MCVFQVKYLLLFTAICIEHNGLQTDCEIECYSQICSTYGRISSYVLVNLFQDEKEVELRVAIGRPRIGKMATIHRISISVTLYKL